MKRIVFIPSFIVSQEKKILNFDILILVELIENALVTPEGCVILVDTLQKHKYMLSDTESTFGQVPFKLEPCRLHQNVLSLYSNEHVFRIF